MPLETTPEADMTSKRVPLSANQTKTSLTEEEKTWLTDEFWPIPKWLEMDELMKKEKKFDDYFRYDLRTRYYELEGDFRTAYLNFAPTLQMDFGTAKRVIEFLTTARKALESDKVDLLTVANLLDLAERYIIWLFPGYMAKQRVLTKAKHFELTAPKYSLMLRNEAEKVTNFSDIAALSSMKSVYDEIVGALNKQKIHDQISYGLQIERLEILRRWGSVCLIASILFLPLILNYDGLNVIKEASEQAGDTASATQLFEFMSGIPAFFKHLAFLVVFAVMGAIGGFISGLLQVKNTKVNLLQFRESLLKFQLKPIVGGLTAVLITVILSWQILPDIEIKGLGTFILIAFTSGFSERYFLSLLKIDKDAESSEAKKKSKSEIESEQ